MLFELINTPIIIQSLINNILKKYFNKFCIVYLNNILIFSNNEEEYVKYIIIILKILKKIKLQIKPEKCVFYVNKIKYLKFIIINQKLRMDLIKI